MQFVSHRNFNKHCRSVSGIISDKQSNLVQYRSFMHNCFFNTIILYVYHYFRGYKIIDFAKIHLHTYYEKVGAVSCRDASQY